MHLCHPWQSTQARQGLKASAMRSAGATALMAAAGKGRLHELAMLLAAGAKPEVQSRGGTAREWALRFGHREAAEMLQQHEQAAQEADAATAGAVALSHYQVSKCALAKQSLHSKPEKGMANVSCAGCSRELCQFGIASFKGVLR